MEIVLTKELLIGEGNERACYIHPHDQNLCVKITKNAHREQNKIEYYYFSQLKRKKVPFEQITEFYGKVTTNLGDGLVFERVLNSDKTPSMRLDLAIKNNFLSKEEAFKLLTNLKNYAIQYNIYIGDRNVDQILLQEINGSKRLKIIDGIGTRRYGFKLYLLVHCPYYVKVKNKTRWTSILNGYLS